MDNDMMDDMHDDVEAAYDMHDENKIGMTTCPHCGKKISAQNTAPGSIGGGSGAAAGGGGGG